MWRRKDGRLNVKAFALAVAFLVLTVSVLASTSIDFVPNTPANNSGGNAGYIYVNVTTTGAVNRSAVVDFNNSLLGYWRFQDAGDTNLSDFTRNNRNATMNGYACVTLDCSAVSGYVSNGRFGHAFRSDGLGERAAIDRPNLLKIGLSNRTYEFWIRTENNTIDGFRRNILGDRRRNLLQRSEEISSSPWGWIAQSTSSISSNAGTAPDGTTTAERITHLDGLSLTWGTRAQNTGIDPTSGTFIFGVWLRKVSGDESSLNLHMRAGFGTGDTAFNQGVVVTSDWQYFTKSGSFDSSPGATDLTVGVGSVGTAPTNIVWEMWGAQLYRGSTVDDIYAKTTSGNLQEPGFSISTSGNNVRSMIGNATDEVTHTNGLTSLNWHHIAVVIDRSGNMTTYIDGERQSATSISKYVGQNLSSTNALVIAGTVAEGINTYNGTIDELRIWNRVLSHQEVNASFNNSLYALNRNFSDLREGNYSAVGYVVNGSGDINTTGFYNFIMDTTPPVMGYGVNADGNSSFHSRGYVYMNVTLSELNFRNITASLRNGSGVFSVFNSSANVSGFGNSFNFSGLVNGTYLFHAAARDAGGNVNTTTRNVTIDTVLPTAQYGVNSDANGTTVGRNWLYLNVTASDTNPFNITASLTSGVVVSQVFNVSLNTSGFGNNFNFTGLADGFYNFSATLRDLAGNVNTTVLRYAGVDTSVPVVTLIHPNINNQTYSNTLNVLVRASCSDLHLYRMNVSVKNSTHYVYTNLSDNINSTERWGNVTTSVPRDDIYTVEVACTDDLTFSPKIPDFVANLTPNQFKHTIDYKKSDNIRLNVDAKITRKDNTDVDLPLHNFKSILKHDGEHIKLDFSFNQPADDSELVLIVKPAVGGTVTLINERTAHFVIDGAYYWHAQDVVQQGYKLRVVPVSNYYEVRISTDSGVWPTKVLVDPVAGGLNTVETAGQVIVDTTPPTVDWGLNSFTDYDDILVNHQFVNFTYNDAYNDTFTIINNDQPDNERLVVDINTFYKTLSKLTNEEHKIYGEVTDIANNTGNSSTRHLNVNAPTPDYTFMIPVALFLISIIGVLLWVSMRLSENYHPLKLVMLFITFILVLIIANIPINIAENSGAPRAVVDNLQLFYDVIIRTYLFLGGIVFIYLLVKYVKALMTRKYEDDPLYNNGK